VSLLAATRLTSRGILIRRYIQFSKTRWWSHRRNMSLSVTPEAVRPCIGPTRNGLLTWKRQCC